eukprot:3482952-Rhodomonas_salina.1
MPLARSRGVVASPPLTCPPPDTLTRCTPTQPPPLPLSPHSASQRAQRLCSPHACPRATLLCSPPRSSLLRASVAGRRGERGEAGTWRRVRSVSKGCSRV